jgi:ATPase subunit of ABC transporter with duplicated ATPase domains
VTRVEAAGQGIVSGAHLEQHGAEHTVQETVAEPYTEEVEVIDYYSPELDHYRSQWAFVQRGEGWERTEESEDVVLDRQTTWSAERPGVGWERLGPQRDRKATNLSGGFAKKLDLALALLKEPDVLVLDEPLADLDPATRRRLVSVATEYATENCVVACTHNLGAFRDDFATLTVLVDAAIHRRQRRSELESGPAAVYEDVLAAAHGGDGNGGNGF